MTPRTITRLALAALVVALPACDGADADDGNDGHAADTVVTGGAPATAPSSGGAAGRTDSGFTHGEAGIESYGRALAAEVEVLREVVARREAARTQQDTIDALYAAHGMQSVPAAAERAGVDADGYRRLDDLFGRVLAARATAARATTARATDPGPDSMATETPGPPSDSALYAGWQPSMREAFERQAPRLDTLWRERMELRARAAGMTR